MVAPVTLTVDITSLAVSTAIPGLAWALLFALAWRYPAFAESVGLGPKVFWLLLPGSILASFALLPIAPVSNDIVAVSFAGAAFPLGIGVASLGRIASPLRRWVGPLFLPLVIETGALLGVVLAADAGSLGGLARAFGTGPWPVELGLIVVLAIAITGGAVVATHRLDPPVGPAAAGTLVLTGLVLVMTFAGSTAIPGVGIAETFPYFLLPPVAAGIAAVLLAPRLFPGREGFALPVAFFAGGWGVTIGADILWQPPLYGSGPGGLYAVGGAGVLDLVYLSCFLGLLGAWGVHRALGRGFAPVGAAAPPPPPNPTRKLREAYTFLGDGAVGRSIASSAEAGRAAGTQARRLLGRPGDEATGPWGGLGVPGWVVSDQANLDGAARAGSDDPREGVRAFATARALVRLGATISRPRFASIAQRLAAFVVDLALLGAVAAGVFAGIVLVTPGGLAGDLNSAPFNAAIYGFVAVALLYFALSELAMGATVGKALLGIEVRDRSLGPVGGVASFVRNTPLLPVLTLFAVGLALSVAIALRGISSNATLTALGLSAGALAIASLMLAVLAAVGLAGAVGVAVIAVTSERQRVGDLWAGTWVVRTVRAPPIPPSAVWEPGRSA